MLLRPLKIDEMAAGHLALSCTGPELDATFQALQGDVTRSRVRRQFLSCWQDETTHFDRVRFHKRRRLRDWEAIASRFNIDHLRWLDLWNRHCVNFVVLVNQRCHRLGFVSCRISKIERRSSADK